VEQRGCRGCGKFPTLKHLRHCAAFRGSDQRYIYSLIHLTLDLVAIEPCGDRPACLARYRTTCSTRSLDSARFKACGRQSACLARYRTACSTHSLASKIPFEIGMCRVMLYVQVAACVCLFSLDKHAAIPVDTHVWQLAVRYYTPHLKGASMWQHHEEWLEVIGCSANFTAGLITCLL